MARRNILITGATGKFGRALVAHFLSAGDQVIAVGRTEGKLAQLALDHAGTQDFVAIRSDLAASGAAGVLAGELATRGLHPDCLVNAARSIQSLRTGPDGQVAREDFAAELLLDVIVPYELTMSLANAANSRLRRVVNIGSQYGTVAANPHLYTSAASSPLHYSVAKAAVAHLSREMAVRLAPRGILVNCVAFGGVEGRVDDEFRKRYAHLCPLGRMLREDEIAGPVDMLLSDASSAITGHVLAVDGGWSAW